MDFRNSELYEEALGWLQSKLPMFSKTGGNAFHPGLETANKLDELFNHPHKKYKTIHIAGTNGKGSTSHMIASVLQAQGYKTGLYTSPELTDFRERMRVNGKMIPQSEVIRFVEEWRNLKTDLKPSFFELTMIMAFDWFAKEKVEYAVIETGLGGRLDSTNIITPILSVITNISFDHTQFLGDTLKSIAKEKAGIIKKETPVVIGRASGDVRKVFEQKAKVERSALLFAEESTIIKEISPMNHGWEVLLENGNKISLPLGGHYQKENIRTVLTALEALRTKGITVSDSSIRTGIEEVDRLTGICGRWQIMNKDPLIICDTGHNVDGLKENMKTIEDRYPNKTKRFVIGFLKDKDVKNIATLFPKESHYYFTQAPIPRAMDASQTYSAFATHGKRGKIFPTVAEAVNAAKKDSSKDDLIYIGGSTFIVAEYMKNI